jgi:hypothetical protein
VSRRRRARPGGPTAGDDRTGRVSDRFRVCRCRAGGHSGSLGRRGSLPRRPGPSDRDAAESARPDRRRVGARIYFRAVESTSDPESSPRQSARRHACQLSDLKARGRDESRAGGLALAGLQPMGVMATDGLVPHAWRARIEKGRFRGLGWRLARFRHVCP